MDTNKIFTFIIGRNFFPLYAPGVSNWTHKMRGKNGHGAPIAFSDADHKLIKAGLKQLTKDLLTSDQAKGEK